MKTILLLLFSLNLLVQVSANDDCGNTILHYHQPARIAPPLAQMWV